MNKTTKIGLIAGVWVVIAVILVYFSLSQTLELSTEIQKPTRFQSPDPNAKEVLDTCSFNGHCAVQELQRLSKQASKGEVVQTFSTIKDEYANSGKICHEQAHHLGEFLYGFSGNLTESLIVSDRSCGGAMFHGVMQNFVKTEIFFEDLTPQQISPQKICEIFDGTSLLQEKWECAHGVGHGLAIAYDFDAINASKRCQEFDTEAIFHGCSEGVFMQRIQDMFDNPEKRVDGDLLYPCNEVDEKFAPPCYTYQAMYIMFKKRLNLSDSFSECNKIIREQFKSDCYFGVGKQTIFSTFYKMEDIPTSCQDGDPKYATDCISGVAYSLTEQFGLDRGIEFCNKMDSSFQNDCFQIIGDWTYKIGQRSDCKALESPEHIQSCDQGFVKTKQLYEDQI